eukprot:jgi/Botrbrau1/7382/Bobra.0316s0025.1
MTGRQMSLSHCSYCTPICIGYQTKTSVLLSSSAQFRSFWTPCLKIRRSDRSVAVTTSHRTACSATNGASSSVAEENGKPGLVDDLRRTAMSMHTRDQSPKEGKKESSEKWSEVQYFRDGYLQYLAESKEVFSALEKAVEKFPKYELLRNTGLERASALEKDIQWFEQEYGMKPLPITDSSPGKVYARHLLELAEKDMPAFLCHFYNTYFAHSAGGTMIGTKLSATLLDRKKLHFYQYEGGARADKNLLQILAGKINELGESLSAAEREHSTAQTKDVFRYAGSLLALIGRM